MNAMQLALTAAVLGMTTAGAQDLAGDTYTAEELAALDRALWAGNMTREDMRFKKDYTAGHGCFSVVKEMMHDPLRIAPWMDEVSALCSLRLSPIERHGLPLAVDAEVRGGVGIGDSMANFDSFHSAEELLAGIEAILASEKTSCWSTEERLDLRGRVTTALAWHTFEKAGETAGYEAAKGGTDEQLFALLDRYTDVVRQGDPWAALTILLSEFDDDFSVFPSETPLYRDTPAGRICLGTMGDDRYEGDFAVLIEPGGDDVYHDCRIGAAYGKPNQGAKLDSSGRPVAGSENYSPLGDGRLGYFIDLGGDDFYDCADVDITLGAAVLGRASFHDLGGGNDRYLAGSCSLGAAMGGMATFYDDGGSDHYSGKVFTQGAAGFGIGIMIDDSVSEAPVFDTAEGNDGPIDAYETGAGDVDTHSLVDNDSYTAWSNAQAFARPRGVALCINRRGNEVYHAGGVYLHAPLFADRYQSFSQGFAIGERGIDWAGGVAMLIDYEGNDRYLGDIYNQGVGYWYGAGLLWDGGGNDLYEMTQYGQGSGIHLAVGGLVDVSGNDSYIMHSGLGQSGSHDLAVSVLHDRGGNDRYHGNTTCNGGALTGSVALFFDREGNDTYAARPGNGLNYADGRRINMGLLIDVGGGEDEYLGAMSDDTTWRQGNVGMGVDWDLAAHPELMGSTVEEVATDVASASDGEHDAEEEAPVPIPDICNHEGELTQEVFDELWEISVRWEVGDNQEIVPHARDRLVAFGEESLPYISAVMDNSSSGLALRAYVYIFRKLRIDHEAAISSMLRENAESGNVTRQKAALHVIGSLKLTRLEQVVVDLLEGGDANVSRRAIGVLGSIGSHVGDDKLIAMLDPDRHAEPLVTAALSTLITLEVDCYVHLRPLLEYPLVPIRETLVKELAAHHDFYGESVSADLADPAAHSPRALRSLLGVTTAHDGHPDELLIASVETCLSSEDWGVRGDAVRLVRHWQHLAEGDDEQTGQLASLSEALERMLLVEADPYVLFCAG
jgi:hypothetical protein